MALDNLNLIVAVKEDDTIISIFNEFAEIWLIDDNNVMFTINRESVKCRYFVSSVIKKLLENDPKFKLHDDNIIQLLGWCRRYLQKQHVNVEQFNDLSRKVVRYM